MDNKLTYIPNEDKLNYPSFTLKLLFEKFRQYKFEINQLKFLKSSQRIR